jgi:Domain of unknown function (DUF4962)/Heparinase II/III-like protein
MRILAVSLVIAATCLRAPALTLDERPAGEGEWGYRPGDGAQPAVNPPGFTWRPTKSAVSYVLQVASDAAFESIVYEARDIPWTAHCPSSALPQGKQFWRYAAVDAGGAQTPWSQVRSFAVTPDAVVFPQPPVAELIARMPREHPRLFFREEDLPRFRELAEGPLAGVYKSIVGSADKLLANPPDTTEPPKYPKEVVRPSAEWKKMWWGNRVRMSAVVGGASTLGFAYRLTGDAKYGQAARDLLMAFAEWDPKGSTNYRYNDEAAMPGLYYGSRAYSWAWPMLSDADRAKVIGVMRVRGQDCFDSLRGRSHLWRPYSSHHNRAWHWLGEVAVAFHGDIPEAEQWLDYAMTVMYTAYPVWSDEDGGWHEGMAYWSSYLSRFIYWTDVVRSAFGIDVFERPFFKRAGDFGMYLMPPGTQHGGFGDQTVYMKSEKIGGLMASLAAGARNPYWKWYADTVGGGTVGFVRAAQAVNLEGKPPADLPSSVCFRGVGVAVLNTDLVDGTKNVQVHFKSSPFFGTQSHGYNANNAFLLNLRGQPVFLRTGRRDIYGSEHHKNWMWHTQSDNAILVNGEGQYRHSTRAKGRIIAFETSPTVDVVAGEAGAAYENLDRWTRRLIFLKPHAILIHDILEAPEPSTYQWMLHTPGEFELGEQHASWEGEPGRVDIRFVYPQDLSIAQTERYDPPPAEWTKWDLGEWHLTAQPGAKAQRQEFLTLVTIDRAPVGLAVPENGEGCPSRVTLTLPDGQAEVELGDKSFAVIAPGFSREFGRDGQG